MLLEGRCQDVKGREPVHIDCGVGVEASRWQERGRVDFDAKKDTLTLIALKNHLEEHHVKRGTGQFTIQYPDHGVEVVNDEWR